MFEMPNFQERLTDIYSRTSELATIEAEIRFAGSTEYSARALRMALVCKPPHKMRRND